MWGEETWKDVERVQTAVAKRILRCSTYTEDDERGAMSFRLRLLMLLEAMQPSRMARVVYDVSAAMVEEAPVVGATARDHRYRRCVHPDPCSASRRSGGLRMQHTAANHAGFEC